MYVQYIVNYILLYAWSVLYIRMFTSNYICRPLSKKARKKKTGTKIRTSLAMSHRVRITTSSSTYCSYIYFWMTRGEMIIPLNNYFACSTKLFL